MIQPSDSEEEEISNTQSSDVVMEEPSKKPKITDDSMQVDEEIPVQADTSMKDSDEEFDKEVAEAAIEEKEAKKEKVEMMSIIHSM